MSGPASVFLCCWPEVFAASASDRLDAENVGCSSEDQATIDQALATSDCDAAEKELTHLADQGRGLAPKVRLALLLQIMRCIDQAFAPIHPRSFDRTGSNELADWLLTANESRRETGAYAEHKNLRLVARGPLTRAQRDELTSYADTLEDRFAYVAAVESHLLLGGTKIELELSHVVDEDLRTGVFPGKNPPGSERVCVVPVAEKFEDLNLKPTVRSNRRYLQIGPSPKINPAEVFLKALRQAGDLDIGLAPEFVMTPESRAKILTSLRQAPAACRLILVGTENTAENDDGLPWNEAVVTNQYGIELWRQRKLWPSMLDEARAKSYKIEGEPGNGPYHEHNASGSYIKVVDIDSIGRCVILICQDVVNILAEDLMKSLQPDWVFVPILDRGFAVKSWFVDRARSLSQVSKARLVGVCSTALPRNDGQDVFCMTLVCASGGEVKGGPPNTIAFKKAEGTPGYAVHHFGKDPWHTISNFVSG